MDPPPSSEQTPDIPLEQLLTGARQIFRWSRLQNPVAKPSGNLLYEAIARATKGGEVGSIPSIREECIKEEYQGSLLGRLDSSIDYSIAKTGWQTERIIDTLPFSHITSEYVLTASVRGVIVGYYSYRLCGKLGDDPVGNPTLQDFFEEIKKKAVKEATQDAHSILSP